MSGVDAKATDTTLAAEYALALLSAQDAVVVEKRIAEDRGFADLVQHWELELAGLADEVDDMRPPPQVLAQLQKDLFAEQDAPWWSKLGIGQAIVGAAAAAGLAYVAFNTNWLAPAEPVADFQAAMVAENDRLVLQVQFFEAERVILVNREVGQANVGRVLELWLVRDGAEPLSLGVLPAAQVAQMRVPDALFDQIEGASLAVSNEPLGGSVSGIPTGGLLAVGPLLAP